MSVTRQRQGGTMDYHPTSPEERISAFRQIVEKKQYAKIDGKMIDLFSANYVVQIYDALNKINQHNFAKKPASIMVHLAFKIMK